MNRSVELHDSTVAALLRVGRDLIAGFASAYLHRSEGRPGSIRARVGFRIST